MLRSALNSLGKFLNIDLLYAARGGFYLSLSQVISALVGFVLAIAFANLLEPSVYGTYRYILSAYTLLSLIALPGMDVAVMRATSRGDEGSLQEGYEQKMRWGFIGTFVACGVGAYYVMQGSHVLAALFLIVGIMLPFMESAETLLAFFNGTRAFRPWMFTETSTQIASAFVLIGTMLITKNILLIVMAYFLPYILIRTVVYLHYKRNLKRGAENLMPYARSMSIFQILNTAGSSLDQIVLYHILGPVQVAIFSLAMAVPTRLQSLLKISGTLAFPKYANREPGSIVRSMLRKMAIFGVSIFIICVVYIVLAPFVFTVVFPKYAASIPYSQVLILLTLSAVTYPFSSYLLAHQKVVENYIYAGVSLALKIATLAIFVPLIGIWGAVLSVLVSALSAVLVTLFFLGKEGR